MSTVPVEIHTDIIGKKLYASRNYNQLRHVYQSGTCNRTQVDWGLTLRQVPGPKPKLKTSASAPTLHTSELAQSRTKREPLAPEHPEGPYQGGSQSLGKYQNFANSAHMCNGLVRVSSGAAPKVDWQLNLRNGMHQNEFNTKWNRHYARPNPLPFEYVPEPISFRRWPGCEGTQAGIGGILSKTRLAGAKHAGTLSGKSPFEKIRTTPTTLVSMILEMMAALLKCWARRSGLVISITTH